VTMQMEAPAAAPPVDPGNQLLAETPAALSTALVGTPGGQRLALTVRTASTTLTLLLSREDAQKWGDQIRAGGDAMSGLILPVLGQVTPIGGESR
jgi:hypothetical protein